MLELDRLAVKYGSDKFGSHWYTPHYERHLSKFRQEPISLLEIGIGGYDDPQAGGASLLMWKEFFSNGNIIGLDYFDKKFIEQDRIKIYQGSQANIVDLAAIIKDFPAGFEVIIDDGSHRSEHVIKTFWCLWDYVKPGGYYVIEDCQTSYWPDFGGSPHEHAPLTSMNFMKSLIDGLNWQEIEKPRYVPTNFDTSIVGMHFYHNIVFIEKGENREGSNFLENNVFKGYVAKPY